MWCTQVLGQCNQHVFSTVGATQFTSYQFTDCDEQLRFFSLPAGGYTMIRCADIGTTFVTQGDGWVMPLATEHPNYPSCIQPTICPGDFDGNGYIDMQDFLEFLIIYNTQCD